MTTVTGGPAGRRRRAMVLATTAAAVAAFGLSVPGVATAGPTPPIRLVDASGRLVGFHRPNGPHNAGGLAGLAWFDFDNDGLLDLFISNNTGHPNALFKNLGNGRFADVAARAGVANGLGNSGVAVADIDNDGWLDLAAAGTGGVETDHQSPTKLFRNNANGTFTDITASSRVTGTKTTIAVAFADINNDALVDLFLASGGDFENNKHPNKLYLNNGNNTFSDISARAGIEANLGADLAGFTDFNKDGWQDIIVPTGTTERSSP
ncbi:MAG: FG-GAP repeat domain-containing protein [Acidimicrobiales bacterium]